MRRCAASGHLQTNDQTGVTEYLNNVEKYVVSSTMKNPQWQRSIVVSGDVADNVRQLKGQGRQRHCRDREHYSGARVDRPWLGR